MTTPDRVETRRADPLTVLESLVAGLRSAIPSGTGDRQAAERAAGQLRDNLPPPEILTDTQRIGDPGGYVQHVLHVDTDIPFSVVALVWRAGQATPIHDHVSWCVVGVIQGEEHETRYDLRRTGSETYLVPGSTTTNPTGSVCGFAPPGDIHLVRNTGNTTAISLHIYGADIMQLGSSVRRAYDLPTRHRR
ncbi:MAG: hypothetical protein ACRDO7_00750 [Nocardioidaceae bacterium]